MIHRTLFITSGFLLGMSRWGCADFSVVDFRLIGLSLLVFLIGRQVEH
jgi:hypothetical protein